MKKKLMVAIIFMFVLRVWVRAERHAGTFNMQLVTRFDFSRYPACGVSRSSYCIQAIRFYGSDSHARLAEAPIDAGMTGPQPIVVTLRVNPTPRHAYAVTVYRDNNGSLREGLPGEVSAFDDSGH